MSDAHLIDLLVTLTYAFGVAVGYFCATRWWHIPIFVAVFGLIQLVPV